MESQYLAQALQAMQAQPSMPSPQGMSLQQMQQMGKDRKAWEVQNPGQSYMGHAVGQAGQNLMAAPGNMMDGLRGLLSLGQPR